MATSERASKRARAAAAAAHVKQRSTVAVTSVVIGPGMTSISVIQEGPFCTDFWNARSSPFQKRIVPSRPAVA